MKSCALNDGLPLCPNADDYVCLCVCVCVYSVLVKGKRTAELLLNVRATVQDCVIPCSRDRVIKNRNIGANIGPTR